MNSSDAGARPTHVRYWILFLLFVVSTISYADRGVLSIAGAAIQKSLHLSKVDLGYIFSAFAMTYAVAQILGVSCFDRFGAKPVYAVALVLWSLFTHVPTALPNSTTGASVVTFLSPCASSSAWPQIHALRRNGSASGRIGQWKASPK